MVERTSRKRRLPAIGGQADDPRAALGAQMRQCRAYKLDRPEEICGELMGDLFVAEFFSCAKKPIARVADDHVDGAKLGEGFVYHASNRWQGRSCRDWPATGVRRTWPSGHSWRPICGQCPPPDRR